MGNKQEAIQFFTREEACAYLRISLRTLHLWVEGGKVRPVKIGHRTYFKRADLDLLINEHQNS